MPELASSWTRVTGLLQSYTLEKQANGGPSSPTTAWSAVVVKCDAAGSPRSQAEDADDGI